MLTSSQENDMWFLGRKYYHKYWDAMLSKIYTNPTCFNNVANWWLESERYSFYRYGFYLHRLTRYFSVFLCRISLECRYSSQGMRLLGNEVKIKNMCPPPIIVVLSHYSILGNLLKGCSYSILRKGNTMRHWKRMTHWNLWKTSVQQILVFPFSFISLIVT